MEPYESVLRKEKKKLDSSASLLDEATPNTSGVQGGPLIRRAHELGVSIFLFSSRASPRVFEHTSTSPSIGFYHDVSSFENTSEYIVLAVSPATSPTASPKGYSLQDQCNEIDKAGRMLNLTSSQLRNKFHMV